MLRVHVETGDTSSVLATVAAFVAGSVASESTWTKSDLLNDPLFFPRVGAKNRLTRPGITPGTEPFPHRVEHFLRWIRIAGVGMWSHRSNLETVSVCQVCAIGFVALKPKCAG